jgi:hypothetical protein
MTDYEGGRGLEGMGFGYDALAYADALAERAAELRGGDDMLFGAETDVEAAEVGARDPNADIDTADIHNGDDNVDPKAQAEAERQDAEEAARAAETAETDAESDAETDGEDGEAEETTVFDGVDPEAADAEDAEEVTAFVDPGTESGEAPEYADEAPEYVSRHSVRVVRVDGFDEDLDDLEDEQRRGLGEMQERRQQDQPAPPVQAPVAPVEAPTPVVEEPAAKPEVVQPVTEQVDDTTRAVGGAATGAAAETAAAADQTPAAADQAQPEAETPAAVAAADQPAPEAPAPIPAAAETPEGPTTAETAGAGGVGETHGETVETIEVDVRGTEPVAETGQGEVGTRLPEAAIGDTEAPDARDGDISRTQGVGTTDADALSGTEAPVAPIGAATPIDVDLPTSPFAAADPTPGVETAGRVDAPLAPAAEQASVVTTADVAEGGATSETDVVAESGDDAAGFGAAGEADGEGGEYEAEVAAEDGEATGDAEPGAAQTEGGPNSGSGNAAPTAAPAE